MKKQTKLIWAGLGSSIILTAAIVPPIINADKTKTLTKNAVFQNAKTLNANDSSSNVLNDNVIFNINGLSYILDTKNFNATVKGFATDSKISNLIIPNVIEYKDTNYLVTRIGVSAFYDKGLLSVVLPSALQTIGANAFADNYISAIEFPTTLISLEDNSFSNNSFKYGTAIYLPADCTWNKLYAFSPFNANNNFSKFTNVVQFIIQNQAVYEYLPNQLGWKITSYMPSVATLSKGAVHDANWLFVHRWENNDQQSSYNQLRYSAVLPYLQSQSIANTAIYLKNLWNGPSGLISFDPKNMQIKFNDNNAFNSGALFDHNANINWNFQLYNPKTNNFVINENFKGNFTSSLTANLFNNFGKNTKFNYGDIIALNDPRGLVNIASNYDSWMLNNSRPLNYLNTYYNLSQSYTQRYDGVDYFMITLQGLQPYVNVTHVDPIQVLSPNVSEYQSFNITGTTIANTKVNINIFDHIFSGTSNDQGHFNVHVNFNHDLALTLSSKTSVLVSAAGTLPVTTHLLGANPINAGILFNIGKSKKHMVILLNGEAGRLQLWNGSQHMPSFTNNNEIWNNSILSSDDTLLNFSNTSPENSVFYIKVTNSENEASAQYHKISLSNEMTIADLDAQIQQISFKLGDTLTLLIPYHKTSDVSIYQMYSNNKSMGYGYKISKALEPGSLKEFYEYQFKIETDGLKNLINENWNGQYTARFDRRWDATNYMISTNGGDGGLEDDNQASNWYNPSLTMKKVVKQITSGLATDYEKEIAVEEWVAQNMHYTFKYDYGHTIDGTFSHLEGVCGNFAALAAVMCQMAGLVSRVAIGYAIGGVNYWSQYWDIDHAWTEVWLPSLGEWVTLDPTWNWFGPLGQLQNRFWNVRSNEHICTVLWPKGTNYFSYFKGHEYEALSFLGMFFNVQSNQGDAKYPLSTAAAIAALLEKAGELKTNHYAYVN